MQTAIEVFHLNIQRVRDLIVIVHSLGVQTTPVLDLSDILRATLVMSVSALDNFIHQAVRAGILEALEGTRDKTDALLRLQVSLGGVLHGSTFEPSEAWLDGEVRAKHGHLSFQMPEQIADAVRLITSVPLWNTVATKMGEDTTTVTNRLKLIVQRRNKIAHEADIMADYSGQLEHSDLRSPINESMVEESVSFIEQLGEAIFATISVSTTSGNTI